MGRQRLGIDEFVVRLGFVVFKVDGLGAAGTLDDRGEIGSAAVAGDNDILGSDFGEGDLEITANDDFTNMTIVEGGFFAVADLLGVGSTGVVVDDFDGTFSVAGEFGAIDGEKLNDEAGAGEFPTAEDKRLEACFECDFEFRIECLSVVATEFGAA